MKLYKTVLLLHLLFLSPLLAIDWPDWRGLNRDGVWRETGIVTKFENNPIPAKWRTPVGSGYSGPSVSNGRVYLTDRIAKKEIERILCLDEETGAKVWAFEYAAEYKGVGYPAGPRASVIINDKRAYSLGTMGHMFCLDAGTGAVLWKRDLNSLYQINMPIWGIAAAPLIEKNTVYLQIGGSNGACIIALDKTTGAEKWTALDDEASYVAPIMIDQAGKRVLVVWTANHIAGLDPVTGRVFWKHPFEQKMGMAISTPVLYKNFLFISSFFNGSLLLELDQDKVASKIVWQRSGKNERNTDALHCCINTPVILDDYIYGIDSYGELRCLELETGDRVWQDTTVVKLARWANVHFIQNKNKIWMFNENGELIVSRLSPSGFEQISRAKLIEPTTEQLSRKGIGVTWAHPAFANKHIFIRNDDELICADLSE
jgi:outer membrane protein assembly factor BamB